MNAVTFSLSFLKEKLKDVPFQVWGYHYDENEAYLIQNIGDQALIRPHVNDLHNTSMPYKVAEQKGQVLISFFYPEGNQVHVRVFHHSVILSKKEIQYLFYFLQLAHMKEALQIKDTELNNLVDSIRSITSSLDLEEVLEEIMRNALKVIPATDAGYLLLYDHAINRLVPKAPIGFNKNIYNFKVKIGEAITGKVFEDGVGRIYNSKADLYKLK